jgi:hypothetical protein
VSSIDPCVTISWIFQTSDTPHLSDDEERVYERTYGSVCLTGGSGQTMRRGFTRERMVVFVLPAAQIRTQTGTSLNAPRFARRMIP